MSICRRYIVLVHGLWDTPKIFKRLSRELEKQGFVVLVPNLPHKFGRVSIPRLAKDLDDYILNEIGEETILNILGFSMGGLIARFWLQFMNGIPRTHKFFSIGSPQNGTYTAQLIPSSLFKGIAQMKRDSSFLKDLNEDIKPLQEIICISYFCISDLMVLPGWEARLPVGPSFSLPVLTHKGLITNPKAIEIIVREFRKTN